MKLISPSEQFKNSFIQAVKDYQRESSHRTQDIDRLNIADLENNFSAYVSKLISQSKGDNLPEGYVPQTTFWLIDKNEFIGRISIRHSLNPHLLKVGGHIGYDIRPSKRKLGYGKKILGLALQKAKEIGIQKALVTCDETNIGSNKIIQANGGVLENRVETGSGKPAKMRYWITIK